MVLGCLNVLAGSLRAEYAASIWRRAVCVMVAICCAEASRASVRSAWAWASRAWSCAWAWVGSTGAGACVASGARGAVSARAFLSAEISALA